MSCPTISCISSVFQQIYLELCVYKCKCSSVPPFNSELRYYGCHPCYSKSYHPSFWINNLFVLYSLLIVSNSFVFLFKPYIIIHFELTIFFMWDISGHVKETKMRVSSYFHCSFFPISSHAEGLTLRRQSPKPAAHSPNTTFPNITLNNLSKAIVKIRRNTP